MERSTSYKKEEMYDESNPSSDRAGAFVTLVTKLYSINDNRM